MLNLTALISKTNAFKTVKGDKELDRLSHAYLLLCSDSEKLSEYLKFLAKLIACENGSPCEECRACKLIDENAHSDVLFYPSNGSSVLVDDINSLISESYVKPLEGNKKIFIISHAETMNLPSQNKLLKTLEEPPKGVHILIGATSEYPLLSTVKSRVKKIEIPLFTNEQLFEALSGEFDDKDRLKNAIACGDGTVGKALALYANENLSQAIELAVDTLLNMKSSALVLDYSNRITALPVDITEFLSVLELLLRDMLAISQGKSELVSSANAKYVMDNALNFSTGAIINAIEKINEAYERKKFNANDTMLVEWLLFQILEGKYKWQKL